MAFTRKNEEAVSPVIGVILMVAITVILAAVIAAFVFGMAGNIQKTKVVAATLSRINPNLVAVTYQGGQDAGSLIMLNFTVNGQASVVAWGGSSAPSGVVGVGTAGTGSVTPPSPYTVSGYSGISGTNYNTALPIGTTVYLSNAPANSNLEVIGGFADGSTQVIVQNTL